MKRRKSITAMALITALLMVCFCIPAYAEGDSQNDKVSEVLREKMENSAEDEKLDIVLGVSGSDINTEIGRRFYERGYPSAGKDKEYDEIKAREKAWFEIVVEVTKERGADFWKNNLGEKEKDLEFRFPYRGVFFMRAVKSDIEKFAESDAIADIISESEGLLITDDMPWMAITKADEEKRIKFPDLPSTHWAYSSLTNLAEAGIFKGYDDGTARPEKYMTRAELVSLLVKAYNITGDTDESLPFADVKKTDWFYSPVAAAYKSGLVHGRSDTAFAPDALITREEFVTLCGKSLEEYKNYALPDKEAVNEILSEFLDADEIAEYARAYASLAKDEGIISGYAQGAGQKNKLCPQNPITRAEAACILFSSISLDLK